MRNLFIIITAFTFFLAGCGTKNESTANITAYSVKVVKAESLAGVTKDFTGVAESDKTSNLAFLVGGQIIKMLVSEGQQVKKGQLLAELDPTDIILEVEAYRSQFQTTKSTMERNKRLLSKQAISQQDYEMTETQFVLAKANYEGAMNKLSYTKLHAPFDGVIEKKMVENFQTVNPGAGIVRLVQPSNLVVWFTVPDNNMESLRGNATYKIEFDAFKGRQYSAKIKEFIDSSPDGTGIPVSLVIDDPSFDNNKLFIKPGFAARVIMNIQRDEFPENYVTVPLTAVFTDLNTKEPSVWLLNKDNTVTRKAVEIVSPHDNNLLILSSGVSANDIVVSAGVNKITEGAQVKVLN